MRGTAAPLRKICGADLRAGPRPCPADDSGVGEEHLQVFEHAEPAFERVAGTRRTYLVLALFTRRQVDARFRPSDAVVRARRVMCAAYALATISLRWCLELKNIIIAG